MKITIDTEQRTVTELNPEGEVVHSFSTPKAFELISEAWLQAGWDTKYVYTFEWLGRPIIQLPEDMLRIQETLFAVKPDVIIETGVAHGGSLVFYASLCKAMGRGRVVGIDIEIRPHNRQAIEEHFLFDYITLVEGSSTEPAIVDEVKQLVKPGETALVILDSCHTKEHVLAELEAYASLVSIGSYIVATDGIMGLVVGAPRTEPGWRENNPEEAAKEFVARNPGFCIEQPAFPFNESELQKQITYWPSGYIKRVS
ncbi:MAG: cephalosporin hydroxylase [Mariniblastus sp.]|jgi:cephalosporin hydroxylase